MLAGVFCVSASADDSKPVNVHQLMKAGIAPQTQVVWDVSNKTLEDEGAKLQPAEWDKIVKAASAVKSASTKLVTAPRLLAAAPNEKIQDEGAPGAFGAKEVQAVIDANPAVFHAFAQQLAAVMDEVTASAKTKDVAKLNDAAGRLDQVCEACHQQFWYPNQRASR